MINLKRVVKDFKTFTENHKQLNSFGFGDIKQLTSLISSRTDDKNNVDNLGVLYPLLYMVPEPAVLDDRTTTLSFNVIICDILNTKNYDNELDVLSNTLLICQDVLAEFKRYNAVDEYNIYENYEVKLPATCVNFSESTDDYVAGWNINMEIVLTQPLDRCDIPIERPTP